MAHQGSYGYGFSPTVPLFRLNLVVTRTSLRRRNPPWLIINAGVAELADALDLGSSVFGRGGSTPSTRTKYLRKQFSGRTPPCQGGGRGFESRLPLQLTYQPCRGGGIGRRTGLKILRQVTIVPVRVRPSAPLAPVAQLDRAFDYGSRGQGFDSSRARQLREVAQLGRALGLGPRGRRFESCLPDHKKILWGLSSAGRAPALHAGGQRFDPARLHFIIEAAQLSWRERTVHTREVGGSIPSAAIIGPLAQLVRAIGS